MSVLGFVKEQRVPTGILGDDERFQKELQAVRGKLGAARKGAPAIYRAGHQPAWLAAAAASNASAAEDAKAAAANVGSAAHKLQHKTKADLQAATGDVHRARRVESSHLASSSSAAAAARRPAPARILSTGGRDADGDEEMADEEGERDDEEAHEDTGRHREGGRRRPVEAAIIVAAPSGVDSSAAAAALSSVHIDTSQLDVPEPADDDDQDGDADAEARQLAERRRRAREKAAQREAEEEARLAAEAVAKEAAELEEEEEEEEEESEYETDSDDERRRMLLKPIFRSKAQRDTLAERERLDAEEQKLEEDRVARRLERKQQSKALVLAELTREVEQEKARALAANADSDVDLDDGEVDEELELDRWKLRELRRLKRDRDERMAYEAEQALIERRRGMTDAEIEADNARLGLERVAAGSKDPNAEPSMRFMQKYYHRGGFFQDEASIAAAGELASRDFQQPTGADRDADMQLLPAVMQVKKFAMKGRTKYTHLVDQDTTRRDENPWARRNTLVERGAPKGSGEVIGSRHAKKHRS